MAIFMKNYMPLSETNPYKMEGVMKICVTVVVATLIFADVFLMWCLFRANALYEQNENKCMKISGDENTQKQIPSEIKENT